MLRHFQPQAASLRRVGHAARALARPAADRRDRRPDRPARRSTSATGRSARSSARRSTWPPSTAASSTRSTWTSTCATTASRRCGSASDELSPGQIIEQIRAQRAARPRRGRLSHRHEVGQGPRAAGRARSTSSATATRATPARSWTACSWSRSPTASSRAWPSPPRPSGADEGFFYIRAEYPLAVQAHREALERLRGPRPAGRTHAGHRLPPATVDQGRGRRVRLRRGDGPDRLDRGPARHAAAAAALSGRERTVGQADLGQQRRNLRPGALDHPPRRRGLRRAGHREEQGHQGLRAGRQGPPRRADRSADGHHHPPDRRGDRRRRGRRAAASRRCRSAGPRAAACPPSWPTRRSTTRP